MGLRFVAIWMFFVVMMRVESLFVSSQAPTGSERANAVMTKASAPQEMIAVKEAVVVNLCCRYPLSLFHLIVLCLKIGAEPH